MQDRLTQSGSIPRRARTHVLCAAVVFFVVPGALHGVQDSDASSSSATLAAAGAPNTRTLQLAAAIAPAGDSVAKPEMTSSLDATRRERAVSSTIEGRLKRGDTLGRAMKRGGVSRDLIHRVTRAMAEDFDFRRSQPGHAFRVALDHEGELLDFHYFTSQTDGFHVYQVDGAYRVERDETQLVAIVSRLAGTVVTSLYDSIRIGASAQLATDFTDIFAWDIDFSRAVRQGDEFRVLYERLYAVRNDGSREFVRPGSILAAEYEGAAGSFTAVYFEPEEGRGGYYRRDGTSVERRFLLTPLRYGRISSRYTSARRHPILKVTRPHYGIDYAAPAGTPVWAVADGQVIYRSPAGGFGNLVKVRHANGYVSYYSHLARFPKGLQVGDRVHQKQLVGYVGATGLATGPHVCFRVTHNGKYVDPLRLQAPEGKPVPHEVAHLFQGTRDILLAELDGTPLFAVDNAL